MCCTVPHNSAVTSNPAPARLLTRAQVQSLLRWPALIEATAQALIEASAGRPAAAVSSQLHVPGAALHLKSGALAQPPTLTVKANLRPEAGGAAGLIVAFGIRRQLSGAGRGRRRDRPHRHPGSGTPADRRRPR
jgi:hypothetical protein